MFFELPPQREKWMKANIIFRAKLQNIKKRCEIYTIFFKAVSHKISELQPVNYKSSINMSRPDPSRVAPFYHNYVSHVQEDNLADAFAKYSTSLINFLETIPAEKYDYRYAEGKWTIKEVLQHIIDAERIFTYRALRFARQDHTPLPGFDENNFADNSKAQQRDWHKLVEEFKAVRKSSEYLFNSFDEEQLESSGLANNSPTYVLGIGFLLIGHSLHHQKVLQERYLK